MVKLIKNDQLIEDGYVIEYKKNKIPMFINTFILILVIYTFFRMGIKSEDILRSNLSSIDINQLLLGSIAILGMIQAAVIDLTAYLRNQLTFSDSFVAIRRADLGKTYIVSKKIISAKQKAKISCKSENYKISLYLKNGSKVNTGMLYCAGRQEFSKIYREFDFREITEKEKNNLSKNYEIEEGDFVTETNYFAQVLVFLPAIMIMIIVAIYFNIYSYNF